MNSSKPELPKVVERKVVAIVRLLTRRLRQIRQAAEAANPSPDG